MATIQLATGLDGNGSSNPVPLTAGQYLFAVSGSFGSGTVQLMVNIGPDVSAPVTDALYSEDSAQVVWLPDCTAYIDVSGSSGSVDISAALGELSTALD